MSNDQLSVRAESKYFKANYKYKTFTILTGDVDKGGVCACMEQRVHGKSLCRPLNFVVKLKLL